MKIIEELENTKSLTLPHFELSDEDLNKSYAPGKWSIRQILHHLADTETVLYERIRRIISEPRSVIWAFDQDAWAMKLDYTHMPLAIAKNIYSSVREAIIYRARQHYDLHGHLEFVHSETGIRTLKEEFDKVAKHNRHHLEQIQAGL